MSKKTLPWLLLGLILAVAAYLYFFNNTGRTGQSEQKNAVNNSLAEAVKNSAVREELSGEMVVFQDKVLYIDDEKSSFILPLEITSESGGKSVYLGVFIFDQPGELRYVESYLLGENVVVERIHSYETGPYSLTVGVEYFDNEGKKQDLTLRRYSEKGVYEPAQECEEIATVEEREKSNGERYSVCVFEEGRECTLNAYKSNNCPVGGYDVSVVGGEIEKWGIAEGFLFKEGEFIFRANYSHCEIADFYFNTCQPN